MDANSISQADCDGRTCLHWAAYHGRHKSLRLLVEKGMDVLAADKEGEKTADDKEKRGGKGMWHNYVV